MLLLNENDNCSDLMLCFQSLLGLGMSGICIQWHTVGRVCNVFIQRLQTF